MATIKIKIKNILYNLKELKTKLDEQQIKMIFVVKLLNGNTEILKNIIDKENIFAVGDSKIETLKWIKENSKQKTILIKPPAENELANVINYCDYSHACNLDMIKKLNNLAKQIKKKQKIFIIVEMGDCREGFYRTNLKKRLNHIQRFKYIDIVGIGANFGCLTDKAPTLFDLKKLCETRKKAEKILGKKIILSAGASNSLPLFEEFPESIDLVRIGTSVFLGHAGITKPLLYLKQDTFSLTAEILQHRNREYLLNFGDVDVPYRYLNSKYKFVGSSSEMSVIRTSDELKHFISFDLHQYKAVRNLMLSPNIVKEILWK